MRTADIEIGGVYAYSSYEGLVKIRILEKGLRSSSYSNQRSGVRFERLDGARVRNDRAKARSIEPWTERHDARLSTDKERKEREERAARVGQRLGIDVFMRYGRRVEVFEDDFYALAEKLGVSTD